MFALASDDSEGERKATLEGNNIYFKGKMRGIDYDKGTLDIISHGDLTVDLVSAEKDNSAVFLYKGVVANFQVEQKTTINHHIYSNDARFTSNAENHEIYGAIIGTSGADTDIISTEINRIENFKEDEWKYGICSNSESADTSVSLDGSGNYIKAQQGVLASYLGEAVVKAHGSFVLSSGDVVGNYITSYRYDESTESYALKAEKGGYVELLAETSDNLVDGNIIADGSASHVSINGIQNNVRGALISKNVFDDITDTETQEQFATVDNNKTALTQINVIGSKVNQIFSEAKIENPGNINTIDKYKEKSVVSALYAEGEGADITLNGEFNRIQSYADSNDYERTLERTVWAYNGADITINGGVYISTDRYDDTVDRNNSDDIAIVAGTAVNLSEEDIFDKDDSERSTVAVNYKGQSNHIEGDLISAFDGNLVIKPLEETRIQTYSATHRDNIPNLINIKGNAIAGNGGKLSIDLGDGGT